ncbi:transposase [Malonomonas rubra]|uniref:transposase n=1 Tax=Malonomonas rubra TaxID=57040 RepID=UPI0034E96DD5
MVQTGVSLKRRPARIEDFPSNEVEFDRRFHTEDACPDYLLQLRWAEGFRCSRCGHDQFRMGSRGLFSAGTVNINSVTAGTIVHGTRKPLTLWFKVLW